MVAAPEVKQTTLVEMKSDEKKDIAEQKTKEIEKIKEDAVPEGSKDVSEEPDNSEKIEKATEKFAAGKKALLQNLAQEAVDHFNVACELMSSVHGDMSPKMCEFYFNYGKALLELARIEEGVLGNALTGEEKTDEDEEKENEGDEEEEVEGEEVEGEDTTETEGEEQASQDGGDVSSLQLSWEVLQLAKTIYEKNESRTKDEDLKLSQVYLKLGEVSLENETYSDSIEMNSECLKLQEANLSSDDRWLAETHYQLGLAHSFANNFEDSIKHYESAVSVIKMRMKNDTEKLEKDEIKITDDLDESKLTEEQKSTVTDFKELQKLLPQLEEKITDIKETKASFAEKLKAMKNHLVGEIGGVSSTTSTGFGESSTSDAKPISTSMIRKKRKPEEESSDEKESKKAKTSPSNGDSEKKEEEVKDEEKMDTDKKSES